MSFTTDVYIAFQLQTRSIPDNSGWVLSGANFENSNVSSLVLDPTTTVSNPLSTLPISTDTGYEAEAPATREAYSVARSMNAEVGLEYAGINSSGGPQVAGRSNHEDMVVARDCDLISPYLFQYCSSGWQLPLVYLIRYIGSESWSDYVYCHEWSLSGVQVTNYKFSHGRSYNAYTQAGSLNSRETVSLLYTTAKFRCSKLTGSVLADALGEWKGWDTGTNLGIGMPS